MNEILLYGFAGAVLVGCDRSPYPKSDSAFAAGRLESCGDIRIHIAEAGDPSGAAVGAIVFQFTPATNQVGCCTNYGWIQHTRRGTSPGWFYDNGAAGGGGTGAPPVGSQSDPEKPDQPVERPAGDGHWRENPWYGAETSTSALTADQRNAFARNPRPQTTIGDKPEGSGDCFRTQLVCVATGRVLFTWEWCDGKGYTGRIVRPP